MLPADAATWLLPLLVILTVPEAAAAAAASHADGLLLPPMLGPFAEMLRGDFCCTKLPGTSV